MSRNHHHDDHDDDTTTTTNHVLNNKTLFYTPPPRAPSSTDGSISSDLSETTKSVCGAAALVGETVLMETKSSTSKPTRGSRQGRTKNHHHGQTTTTTPYSNARRQQPPPPQDQDEKSRTTRAKEYLSSSYVSGVQWWQERKERKQREALERQVEEQRRILLQAQQQQQQQQHDDEHDDKSPPPPHQQQQYHHKDQNPPLSTTTTTTTSTEEGIHNSTPMTANRRLYVHPSHSGAGLSVDLQLPESPHTNQGQAAATATSTSAATTAALFPTMNEESWVPPVRVEPEPPTPHPFCPYLLSPQQMQQVAIHCLPPGISYAKWKRLYSLARDGDAFDHFLSRVKGHAHTLLVVRTTRNDVFGGYADSAWETQPHGGAVFYGSAQASLFSYAVDVVDGESTTRDINNNNNKDESPRLHVFKWTGANRYIQLCDVAHKMIAFGGGGEEGAFGLCLEQDFQRGSTGSCDTFQNVPLCVQDQFEVVDLEVYGFLIGQF